MGDKEAEIYDLMVMNISPVSLLTYSIMGP
jgi:hypothetical protein